MVSQYCLNPEPTQMVQFIIKAEYETKNVTLIRQVTHKIEQNNLQMQARN